MTELEKAARQEPVAWVRKSDLEALPNIPETVDDGYTAPGQQLMKTILSPKPHEYYGQVPLYTSPQPAPATELREQELAEASVEPVAWMPIEQMYPQAKAIDILMGDGSILCSVLPQFDGDLWWEGSGTGEKFIDPKYANVTHWRIHGETRPQTREPLNELAKAVIDAARTAMDESVEAYDSQGSIKIDSHLAASLSLCLDEYDRAIEAAHGIGEKK